MATSEGRPSCSGCGSDYQLDEAGPYLLHCLHSICHRCRGGTTDIRCRLCTEQHSSENNALLTLPKDVVTAKAIFLWSAQHNPSELTCSNKDDGLQAVSWCEKCEAFLCEDCQASHEEMKATRRHKVLSIKDICTTSGRISISRCSTHTDHPFTFFDNSCNVPICAMCVLTDHQDCTREDLAGKSTVLMLSLRENLKSLLARQDRLAANKSAHKQHQFRLSEKQDQLEEHVTNTFNELQSVLRQREKQVKIQLENCFMTLKNRNKEQEQALDVALETSTKTGDFLEKCLSIPDPVYLLSMSQIVENRVSSCLESHVPKVCSQDAEIMFGKNDLQMLTDSMTSFGTFFTRNIGTGLLLKDEMGKDVLLKRPAISFNKERLNYHLVRVDEKGNLVNEMSHGEYQNGSPIKYSGTIAREPLSVLDLQLWRVKVKLELWKDVQNLLLFETGITDSKFVDEHVFVSAQHFTFLILASHCGSHNSICLKSRKHGKDQKCLPLILNNSAGEKVDLQLDFVYNPEKSTLSVIDVYNENVLVVLEDRHLGSIREYYPVFGLFNKESCHIEMSVISGRGVGLCAVTRKLVCKS